MNKWYINQAKALIEQRLEDYTEIAAEVVRSEITRITPLDEGNLKGGNDKRKMGKAFWRVFNNVEYAPDVEFGTGPHEIVPKEKKALHFFIKGAEIFAKRVMHPGTKAKPFMRPGYRNAIAKLRGRGIV